MKKGKKGKRKGEEKKKKRGKKNAKMLILHVYLKSRELEKGSSVRRTTS